MKKFSLSLAFGALSVLVFSYSNFANAIIDVTAYGLYGSAGGNFVDTLKANPGYNSSKLTFGGLGAGANVFVGFSPVKIGAEVDYLQIYKYDDGVLFKQKFNVMPVMGSIKLSLLDIIYAQGAFGYAPGLHTIEPYNTSLTVTTTTNNSGSTVGMVGAGVRFGGLLFGIEVGGKYFMFFKDPALNVAAISAGISIGI